MDENAEIDIEALSDEVYIPLNLLPAIVRNLNSRLAAIEHEHSADDITSGTLPAARIAEGSLPGSKIEEGTVTLDRFEKSVRDSLSRFVLENGAVKFRVIQTDDRDGFGIKLEGALNASVLIWVGGSTISVETVSPSGTSNATFRSS